MDRKEFIRCSLLAVGGLNYPGTLKAVTEQKLEIDGPEIINSGVSGNNTNNLLARVQIGCLDHKPDLTIMMIGTNDMNNGKHIPLEKYRQNLDRLVDLIFRSGSQVLLLSILPFYEPYLLTRHPASFFEPEGSSGRRKQLNEVIKTIAAERNIHFFDVGELFEKVGKIGTNKDSLLRNELNSGKTDGVHPTPNGYRFLALSISQYIRFNRLPTKKIICFGDSITRGDGSVEKESYPAYLKKLLS